ncbi:MFS transporter [Nocardiopsis alborubida]|uniref:MFS transporter n=1 Tax=Nocardiopsis alborubida TaxID=146802 RepID=A0A7X6RNQ2_9ACTN|nr:MFS transporter [Nocardiopsis alborubida]NKY97045.1 MFS transporter [Nocardiopsis alborubida]
MSAADGALGRRFWRLWSAFLSSNLADGVSFIVLPWLATAATDSAFWVAATAAAGRLPWLFAIPAGVLVDRCSSLRLMAAASTARVVSWTFLAVLALTGQLTLPVLLAGSLVLGVVEVLYDTAALTALPRIVPRSALVRANGHLKTAEITAQEFAGRPLGGVLLGLHAALALAVNAVFAAVSALLLTRLNQRKTGSGPPDPRPRPRTDRHGISAGVRTIVEHPLLRRTAIATVCFNVVYAAILATQVLFAQEVLGLNAAQFGLVMTAAAVGGVAGGQLSGRAADHLPAGWLPMASLCVVGLSHTAIACVPRLAVVIPALALSSAAVLMYSVSVASLRQRVTPQDLLGRVNAAMGSATWGVAAIGMAAGGVLVDVLSSWTSQGFALRSVYAVSAIAVLVILTTVGRRITRLGAQAELD